MKQVLPLAPEPIQNEDGSTKQDCEINVSKRIIAKIRKVHPKLKIIITGDGLYSKQPFVDELKTANMSYILVAKPTDHKILFEWIDELTGLGDDPPAPDPIHIPELIYVDSESQVPAFDYWS